MGSVSKNGVGAIRILHQVKMASYEYALTEDEFNQYEFSFSPHSFSQNDVKVQKSNVASFQPSQKARDWSSLEQSLESVFSVQDQNKSQANVQLSQSPQPFQFVQPQNNNVISQNVEDDEFDDFVDPFAIGSRLASFQEESPVHQFKPKTTSESVTSEIDIIEDDDNQNITGDIGEK